MRIHWPAAASVALILVASSLAGAATAQARPKVRIDSGELVGAAKGEVVSFKGVPYAAAPVGALRWAPPSKPAAWTAQRFADAYGPICPQKLNADGTPNEGGASGASSEDCLFLNVWAPKSAIGGPAKAPVMVWLHGGGNTSGAGSLGAYEGSAFVRDGVILVTLNYRLGPLGFFAHPALTKAARPDEPLVAYGIMDQIAALQWVKRNIAAFGGDPGNVTLFGESAGGGDTLALMTIPSAAGVFARAIVESGGGWTPPATLAAREAQGQGEAVRAGAPAGASVDQLRALPVEALVALPLTFGGVAVDGRLMKESPSQAIAAGRIAHVPLMIGSNSFEASLMKTFKAPPAAILAMAPPALMAAYADQPTDKARAEALFTDAFMGAPAHWVAGKASGGPSWLYHFAYVVDVERPTSQGAGHATEIPFVFESWDTLGVVGRGIKPTPNDLAVTRLVHSCWVSFAKTGVPVCAGAPAWPAFTVARDTLIDFDSATTLKTGFRKAQYQAQEATVLPTLGLAR